MVNQKQMQLIIGADVFPTPGNAELFENGSAAALVGEELLSQITDADYRVYNLEGALTDDLSPILKDGPVISAPKKTARGLKALQADLIVLANNHVLDHDQIGAENTIAALKENNIAYIGLGKTREERSTPYFFEKDCLRVGIYNCCEHESSVLKEGLIGANGFDPLETLDDITRVKQECDYLVVLYHGGKERFRYPSPELIRVFRKFAEKGADVVIAQHTHCIGCYERYENAWLLYGQGNFIFDRADNEFYNSGVLVRLTFEKNNGFNADVIPFVKNGHGVKQADENEKKTLMDALNDRSVKLQDVEFIECEYKNRAAEYAKTYLTAMHGDNRIDQLGRRVLKNKQFDLLLRKSYSKQLLTTVGNYVTCEAHLELLREGLKTLLTQKE